MLTKVRVKPLVLIVDDEPDAVELLEFNLRKAGYDVSTAVDGNAALERARTLQPDLILLDLMIPEVDGMEVCKLIRRNPATSGIPVIMLTAKAGEIDRVVGLELGADDYVTKPYSPRELLLRIRNVLRRGAEQETAADRFTNGNLTVDVAKHSVIVNGRPVDLTATEFKLLTLLIQRRGRVQSREQLLQDVWNYNTVIDTRTVDTHMRRLREKLGSAAKYLDTVRGVGYRFAEA